MVPASGTMSKILLCSSQMMVSDVSKIGLTPSVISVRATKCHWRLQLQVLATKTVTMKCCQATDLNFFWYVRPTDYLSHMRAFFMVRANRIFQNHADMRNSRVFLLAIIMNAILIAN